MAEFGVIFQEYKNNEDRRYISPIIPCVFTVLFYLDTSCKVVFVIKRGHLDSCVW